LPDLVEPMKLSIKNMVCPRCIEAVQTIMQETGLPASYVDLGVVELDGKLTPDKLEELREKLDQRGFELIFDRETEISNLVQSTLIQYLHHIENTDNPQRLSDYVSNQTFYNYSYLSKIFSDNKGKTIENYLIQLKIERVKELLSFHKWTLSQIAWKLKYSSVQYLSNQFKKVTGVTVSQYLKEKNIPRKSFDGL
jgi:AraC family transcriptional regulator